MWNKYQLGETREVLMTVLLWNESGRSVQWGGCSERYLNAR